jgi:hypothetical protein
MVRGLPQEQTSWTAMHISTSTSNIIILTCGGTSCIRSKPLLQLLTILRNLGIMIALMIFGCAVYLLATEFISAKKSKGEVLLFRRGRVPDLVQTADEEANVDDRVNTETVLSREKTVPDAPASIQKQTAVFHWDGVSYDIKIKGGPRRLLNDVDGWVKPGTLTALMVRRIPLPLAFNSDVSYRVSLEQERQHFSMSWQVEQLWE